MKVKDILRRLGKDSTNYGHKKDQVGLYQDERGSSASTKDIYLSLDDEVYSYYEGQGYIVLLTTRRYAYWITRTHQSCNLTDADAGGVLSVESVTWRTTLLFLAERGVKIDDITEDRRGTFLGYIQAASDWRERGHYLVYKGKSRPFIIYNERGPYLIKKSLGQIRNVQNVSTSPEVWEHIEKLCLIEAL